MNISPTTRKYLIFLTFLQVDFFVAIETTALLVAAPSIATSFSLGEPFIPWILNAYFLTMFVALVIFLIFEKRFSRSMRAKKFFLEGMIYFILGSIIAGVANSAQLFFFARIVQGIGAAMVSIGQLWTMTESYQDEIEQPLFWADMGFIIGIAAGPFLGGIFSGFSLDGWRWIFILNTILGIAGAILFAWLYREKKANCTKAVFVREKKSFGASFFWVMAIELIISIVVVAQEFIVSTYLQNVRDFTPLATGSVLFAASVGVIVGGLSIVIFKPKDTHTKISSGLQGMVVSIIIFSLAFHFDIFALILFALFLSGLFFGRLGILLFSYISRILDPSVLMSGTIIYIIMLQLGNAFGVEMETVWMATNNDFLLLGFLMIGLLQVTLFCSSRLRFVDEEKDKTLPLIEQDSMKKSLRDRTIDVMQIIVYAIFIWPLRYIFCIQVEGLNRVVVKKPYIIISNHQSMWDAALVLSAIGMGNLLRLYPIRFPINHPLFHWSIIRTVARIIGLYEIKPKGDLDKSLESTFEQIDTGFSLFFFPEARMVRNGGLGQPKKGAAWIATHRDVFFQPAHIFSDRYDSHGLGKPWRSRVVFGEMVDGRVLREQIQFEQLPTKIMQTITGLSDSKLIAKRWRKVFSVQVVDAFQEEYLQDLLVIENQSFVDNQYPDAEQYYRNFLMNSENLVIFLTYGGKRVGQVLLRPHNSAYKDLKEDDRLMKPDEGRYYVESLAILPEYRGSFGFLDLAYKVVEQSQRRGIRKFSMHIRKTRGLSRAFQQFFNKDITLIRHIDSWKWMNNEPYDYIEVTQTRSLASLRRLILVGKCLQILKKLLKIKHRKRQLR